MASRPETLLRLLRMGVADDNAQQEAAEFLAATLSAKNGHDGEEDNADSAFSIARFQKLAEENGELTRRCALLEREAADVPRQLRQTARDATSMAYIEVAGIVESDVGTDRAKDLPSRIRGLAQTAPPGVTAAEADQDA